MVQMALQEVICNGIKSDSVQKDVIQQDILPKFDGNNDKLETDGNIVRRENEVAENDTDAMLDAFQASNGLEIMVLDNNKMIPNKIDVDCLLDESTDVFSSSLLNCDALTVLAEVNSRITEDEDSAVSSEQFEEKTPLEGHNCLLHPTHTSLINKLDASKNTISKLEETINRLEKQLTAESQNAEKLSQLERTILQHEKEIQLSKQEHEIDQRTITSLKKEMETKLLAMKKQYESANKDKESMVMRYAISEKELLDCKKEKENSDKKMKEIIKENESSATKLKTLTNEKLKISQQLESKIAETSNAYKEIDKLKDEINSRDIKIKWTQNKLKSEMDAHKECPIIMERLKSNIKTLEIDIESSRKEMLKFEQNKDLGNTQEDQQRSKLILKNEDFSELASANVSLQMEYQALIKENNLISQQIKNVEQVWLALDGSHIKVEDSSKVCPDDRQENLLELLKQSEQILSEVSHLRMSNEKMLSDLSNCQAKGAELLSLSPFKSIPGNELSYGTNPTALELKIENEMELSTENRLLLPQLRNRIQDLERQLSEEKQLKEENVKYIAKAEEIIDEVDRLRCANEELLSDIEACKTREAELLVFTQKLTSKNVLLQSEFSAVETKANELDLADKKHTAMELNLKNDLEQIKKRLFEEKERRQEETRLLARQVAEKSTKTESLLDNINTLQSELSLLKNKHSVQVKELQRELSQYKRKLEQMESSLAASGGSGSTANSLTSGSKSTTSSLSSLNDSPVLQGIDVPAQVLVERIVKLQQDSAKLNDRIEFLEEHSSQLVKELQKKSRLLQNYIMREQTGALTPNSMDKSKAELSKSGGIMASLYGSKPADESMTFELCLEINRKLQAVLEDTLLKNITLKENIDTLGDEIARLTRHRT